MPIFDRAAGRGTGAVAMVHLGQLLSGPVFAESCFVVDTADCAVLQYHSVATLRDLNPALDDPTGTPFRWTVGRDGSLALANVALRAPACTIHFRRPGLAEVELPQQRGTFSVVRGGVGADEPFVCDGSWRGHVTVQSKTAQVTEFQLWRERELLGRAEHRNWRDVKVAVMHPAESPMCVLAIVIAVHRLITKG